MECPNCQKEVDLTVKRYFTSFLSKFICPHCEVKFKLKRTWKYYLWVVFMAFITFISLETVDFLAQDKDSIALIGAIVMTLLVIIFWYVDRKIENKMPTKLNI